MRSSSVIITRVKFSTSGSYPTRILWRGRDIEVSHETESLASFCLQQTYYWLQRGRSGWQLLAVH